MGLYMKLVLFLLQSGHSAPVQEVIQVFDSVCIKRVYYDTVLELGLFFDYATSAAAVAYRHVDIDIYI